MTSIVVGGTCLVRVLFLTPTQDNLYKL